MSWNPAIEPGCPDQVGVDAIETLIVPRARDLGGFEVRRFVSYQGAGCSHLAVHETIRFSLRSRLSPAKVDKRNAGTGGVGPDGA
ncbi:hypothetical protein B5K08_26575 [Rhizobium leguminosarum bv. trifolii]|uniref:Uncharacterized protein n=1 Tax=Rhizobium leguminosarum bv. trifolii TaxID=386 RepID=A0A3E1B5C5_RHILT|nr:hypothetical protein B5K08_26575 [Rhizobium leguminosarum bv. trifolii]RFB86157.1 hypothetical protein B5K10_25290 [Rhizobium leguminosarum bv. trifolii]